VTLTTRNTHYNHLNTKSAMFVITQVQIAEISISE